MRTTIFQVDAFTTRRFAGNPAAVMPLESFLTDAVLQAIAAENNLAETSHCWIAKVVRELAPDIVAIARMDRSGVIVTAPGDASYDFVGHYFAPARGIPEDPVTGGAHCALALYWAKRLNKTAIRAFQESRRGGEIICRLVRDVGAASMSFIANALPLTTSASTSFAWNTSISRRYPCAQPRAPI